MPAVVLTLGAAAIMIWSPADWWILGFVLFAMGMLFLLEGR